MYMYVACGKLIHVRLFVLCSVTKERDEIFDNYLEQVHMQIHTHTNIYTLTLEHTHTHTHTHTCTK